MLHTTTRLLGLGLLASAAAAQITPVAQESFDYTYPGLLINASGGTGWSNPWFVSGNGNEVVIFEDNGTHPPFVHDNVGNFAGQAQEWQGAFRMPDTTGHPDVVEGGKFGKDGGTIWIGFLTRTYQQFGHHYGGIFLIDQSIGEVLFIGSPWGTSAWGVEDLLGGGVTLIPGTDDTLDTHIVVRIDYMTGDERVRVYLNPGTDHPVGVPDLDVMVPDQHWNELRLSSGGSASQQYWDGLRIDQGQPGSGSVGTNYCGPANLNSSGLGAVIGGSGSEVVAANDVTLLAEQLPANQFSYFINSMNTGFTFPPGSQGILCLGSGIGRWNSNVLNTGSGSLSMPIDLTSVPTPGGPVAVQPGETWHFQLWFRDMNPTATSNFTDGLMVTFL